MLERQVRTVPWWRGLALRLHRLMCPHCRRYAAQIRAIGAAARSLFRVHGEDPKVLERLPETVLSLPETTPTSRDVERWDSRRHAVRLPASILLPSLASVVVTHSHLHPSV